LERIDSLGPLVQEAAYYNTIVALSLRTYDALLRGQLDRLGIDLEDVDLGSDELVAFDPNAHLARLSQVYRQLGDDAQARVRDGGFERLPDVPEAGALQDGIFEFLGRFGHFSDSSSDFSQAPWREDPGLVLQMAMDFAPPGGGRDRRPLAELPIPALRRPLLQALYHRSRRFHWYREAMSSLYTYGYGLFRDLFLALGRSFVRRGVIARPEDIFYLYMDEVREMAAPQQPGRDGRELVAERKEEIEQVRNLIPPDTIFGHEAPALVPDEGRGLRGTPTSRGVHSGPVRVLEGIQDMGRVQKGDVLVIPYSDVGWTPLFAKAGAVVAESGGILSHSSIVAREYGIPAVVSVPGACQLADDTPVTVDGHSGRITVHEH
jgi:pyruvate,water dikinase